MTNHVVVDDIYRKEYFRNNELDQGSATLFNKRAILPSRRYDRWGAAKRWHCFIVHATS